MLSFTGEAIGFSESIKIDKIFQEVVIENRMHIYKIDINKTSVYLRRFGDILAIGISTFDDKPHKTGEKALVCMYSDNNSIWKLVDAVKCIVSLRSIDSDGLGQGMLNKLKTALPYVNWNDSLKPSSLIDAYCNSSDDGLVVGDYCGMNIYANLAHYNVKNRHNPKHPDHYNQTEKEFFKKVNVLKTGKESYQFKSSDDMVVLFTLKSSLPDWFNDEIDLDFDGSGEQFRLVQAGSVFASQLCSMVTNEYLDYRNQMKPKL